MAGKGDILNIRHLQILTSVSNLSSPFCCPIMYCKLIAPSYPRSLQYITLVVLRVLSFHFKNLKLFFPVEQQSVWCQQRNNGSTLGKYTHKQKKNPTLPQLTLPIPEHFNRSMIILYPMNQSSSSIYDNQIQIIAVMLAIRHKIAFKNILRKAARLVLFHLLQQQCLVWIYQ